jgi:choline dehydrogenase
MTHDPKEYSDGPLKIAYQGFVPGSSVPFIRACNETAQTPIVNDLNGGDNIGVKQGTSS